MTNFPRSVPTMLRPLRVLRHQRRLRGWSWLTAKARPEHPEEQTLKGPAEDGARQRRGSHKNHRLTNKQKEENTTLTFTPETNTK